MDKIWKKMNNDRFSDSPLPKTLIEESINLSWIAEGFYEHGDGHGTPISKTEKIVMSSIWYVLPYITQKR